MLRSNSPAIDAVVFDLGGVLIDWNPRHLYRKLIDDEAEVERFLAEVCTADWNHGLDSGRPFDEAIAELVEIHPGQVSLIRAWKERWEEMVAGPIVGTVALLERLHGHGVSLHAITNWSAETFPVARRFPFLERFGTIVVSGEEGVSKPDAAIFELLVDRTAIEPGRSLFIDDNRSNVAAAAALGFRTVHFTDPDGLYARLLDLGLISGICQPVRLQMIS